MRLASRASKLRQHRVRRGPGEAAGLAALRLGEPTAARLRRHRPLRGRFRGSLSSSLTVCVSFFFKGTDVFCAQLLHGRRQQPGGDPDEPRYFTDISYCQHSQSRRLWPSYQMGHKPGGNDDEAAEGGHADFCELRKAAGHGTPHAGPGGPVGEPGEYDWLFDPSWFYSSDTPDRPANP